MLYLVIDTSSRESSIIVYKNNICLCEITGSLLSSWSSDYIVPKVKDILQSVNVSFKDLSFIAVVLGVGYFTGCRVGVTYAKIVNLALDIPIIGLHSLKTLAYEVFYMNNINKNIKERFLPYDYIITTYDIGKSGGAVSIYNNSCENVHETFYLDKNDVAILEDIIYLKNSNKIIVVGNKQDIIQSDKLNLLHNNDIKKLNKDIMAKISVDKFNNKDFLKEIIPIYL